MDDQSIPIDRLIYESMELEEQADTLLLQGEIEASVDLYQDATTRYRNNTSAWTKLNAVKNAAQEHFPEFNVDWDSRVHGYSSVPTTC